MKLIVGVFETVSLNRVIFKVKWRVRRLFHFTIKNKSFGGVRLETFFPLIHRSIYFA